MSVATDDRAEVQAALRGKFNRLMRSSLIAAGRSGNPVLAEFHRHFGKDPAHLPVLQYEYPYHMAIAIQAGIDAFIAEPGRSHRELGVTVPTARAWGRLVDLLQPPSFPMPAPRMGRVEEERREAGYQRWMRCILRGGILFEDDEGPGIIWVQEQLRGGFNEGLRIEVMAHTPQRASAIIDEIRRLSVVHSPYRGQCFSMHIQKGRTLKPQFEERPRDLKAADVILPPGVLEGLEKQALGVARHGEKLSAAKCHRKRGLLMWGRPGTGKTHTIRYLASRLPDHTVILLPGKRLEHLHRMQELIAQCVPGIVVLDDVDFIAEDRTMPAMSAAHNLFDLLETLDGVSPDADLLFILTTNRADTLEPAIAARPGRVDHAVEIPAPDLDCRRRLLALYQGNVELDVDEGELEALLKRTEGVTGAFFKELQRRAAVAAAKADSRSSDGRLVVTNEHLSAAVDEMLDPENVLTARLLGLEGSDHALLGADDEPAPT